MEISCCSFIIIIIIIIIKYLNEKFVIRKLQIGYISQ
jgi:hypothetical protein